jgi:hypothetical protein
MVRASLSSVDKQDVVLIVAIVMLAVSNIFVYIALENQIPTLYTNYQDYVANHHHTNTDFSSMQTFNARALPWAFFLLRNGTHLVLLTLTN